ncbi:hypothetical protein ACQ4PT_070801 [Festuca glaucescens]
MGEEAPSTVTATTPAPHLLLICFPGQGHVNPMLRLAKRRRRRRAAGPRPHPARVPGRPPGRHRGAGRPDEAPPDHRPARVRGAYPAFAELIRRQEEAGRPVSCVVGNPFLPWAIDVSHDAGIPSAVLWVQSCAVFSLYYHHVHGLVEFPAEDDLDARVRLPGLPALSVADVPSFLLPSNPFKLLADEILKQFRTIHKASWVFVNSFSELERDVVDALPGLSPPPPPLIPVGPLVELEEDSAVRGDMLKAADGVVGWLDAQAPRSVVYASLGSVVVLSAEQLAELAHGLASSGRPFLWVVRPDCSAMLPEGYLGSVAGRGMVVPWSPQDLVLAHPSTACFLTHCGWNSTLETLAAGVPVVAFPQWGDQCTDAKYLVEEFRMGVRIGAPLRRDAVRDALEAAVGGPDAETMAENARAWSAAAKTAVSRGGSSDRHVQAFVEEVVARASGRARG